MNDDLERSARLDVEEPREPLSSRSLITFSSERNVALEKEYEELQDQKIKVCSLMKMTIPPGEQKTPRAAMECENVARKVSGLQPDLDDDDHDQLECDSGEIQDFNCPKCGKQVASLLYYMHLNSCQGLPPPSPRKVHQDAANSAATKDSEAGSEVADQTCKRCGQEVPVLMQFIHSARCSATIEDTPDPDDVQENADDLKSQRCDKCQMEFPMIYFFLHLQTCKGDVNEVSEPAQKLDRVSSKNNNQQDQQQETTMAQQNERSSIKIPISLEAKAAAQPLISREEQKRLIEQEIIMQRIQLEQQKALLEKRRLDKNPTSKLGSNAQEELMSNLQQVKLQKMEHLAADQNGARQRNRPEQSAFQVDEADEASMADNHPAFSQQHGLGQLGARQDDGVDGASPRAGDRSQPGFKLSQDEILRKMAQLETEQTYINQQLASATSAEQEIIRQKQILMARIEAQRLKHEQRQQQPAVGMPASLPPADQPVNDLFPSLQRQQQQQKQEAGGGRRVRPPADFMSDQQLMEMVRCSHCDEELVKAFKDDHKCDQKKLDQMMRNRQGELAQRLDEEAQELPQVVRAAPENAVAANADEFQCEKCEEKFSDINEFASHLDFHEIQARVGLNAENNAQEAGGSRAANNENIPRARIVQVIDYQANEAPEENKAAQQAQQRHEEERKRGQELAQMRQQRRMATEEDRQLSYAIQLSNREAQVQARPASDQRRGPLPQQAAGNRPNPVPSQEQLDAILARQILNEDQANLEGAGAVRIMTGARNAFLPSHSQIGQAAEIRDFFNQVGPVIREFGLAVDRGNAARHFANNDEVRVNQRVNNMSEQQFQEHMNELFIRDSQKPIQQTVLSQLPRSKFNKQSLEGAAVSQSKDDQQSEHQCSICMAEYENGEEILTLTCFHNFHSACIEQWFKQQNWCPVCRLKIDENANQ